MDNHPDNIEWLRNRINAALKGTGTVKDSLESYIVKNKLGDFKVARENRLKTGWKASLASKFMEKNDPDEVF